MRIGKARNDIQQRIDEEYIVLVHLIDSTSILFLTEAKVLRIQYEKEISNITEPDPEVRKDMYSSIEQLYLPSFECTQETIYAARRVLLISIYSYFEGILRSITEHNKIKATDSKVLSLINAIEQSIGKLPSDSINSRELVTMELRKLRNQCTHQGKTNKKTRALIEEHPMLTLLDKTLIIQNDQILMKYLKASKSLLQIIEEHCRLSR